MLDKILKGIFESLDLKGRAESAMEYKQTKMDFSTKSNDELLEIFKQTYHTNKENASAAYSILKERGFDTETIRKITGV